MLATNILLLKVRHVTDRYQESKYVAFASMLMFEILIVGLPIVIAVNDSPTATFIVLTGIIALDDIGILCFIFVPKIRFQIEGLEAGVGFGESIMKATLKKASTREENRSASPPASYSGMSVSMSPPIKKNPFANSLVNSCDSIIVESIEEETAEELRLCEQRDSDMRPSNRNPLYNKNNDEESKLAAVEEVCDNRRSIETYLANRMRVGSFRKKENEEASEQAPASGVSPTTTSLLTDQERTKQRFNDTSNWWKGADANSPSARVASKEEPAKLMQLQMASLGTTSSFSVDKQVPRGAAGDVSDAPESDATPESDEAASGSGDAEPEADSCPAVEEYAEPLKIS